MYQLLETIKLQDGVLKNISLHNARFNRSRHLLFGTKNTIYLENQIKIPDLNKIGIFKCRVIYSEKIEFIEFNPYTIKQIKTLKLVYDNKIKYNHKYLDRTCFENHLQQISEDDMLIVKNGLITDVSYANIVFFDGINWLTPSLPLLDGTKRKELLKNKTIIEDDIKPGNLKQLKKARLINAMLDFESSPDIKIVNIIL